MNASFQFTFEGQDEQQGLHIDITSERRLTSALTEAMSEPLFVSQWNSLSDASFRPYSVAVLELSNAKQQSEATQRSIYQDLCLRSRVDVLSDLFGRPVPAKVLKLLSRTVWLEFSRRDWKTFFAIAMGGGSSGLGHVPLITKTLVRQFELIPEELRLPGLLRIVSHLDVPAERWAKLQGFIHDADANKIVEYRRDAGVMKTKGDFWDLYFRCEGKYMSEFDIPASLGESVLLELITSPHDMVSEGIKMCNCLGDRISRVRTGNRIYFRLRDGLPVNAELIRRGRKWVPGEILGWHNSEVTAELAQRIGNELSRLAESTPATNESSVSESEISCVSSLRQEARNTFASEQIENLSRPLQSIQAKSISWSNGAFVVFEMKECGYVQFMSSPDGKEYLIEIASHKYEEYMNEFLSADVVDVIERAGFIWPTGKNNFKRWFSITSLEDFREIAELSLAILSKVFGYKKVDNILIKTHIPI